MPASDDGGSDCSEGSVVHEMVVDAESVFQTRAAEVKTADEVVSARPGSRQRQRPSLKGVPVSQRTSTASLQDEATAGKLATMLNRNRSSVSAASLSRPNSAASKPPLTPEPPAASSPQLPSHLPQPVLLHHPSGRLTKQASGLTLGLLRKLSAQPLSPTMSTDGGPEFSRVKSVEFSPPKAGLEKSPNKTSPPSLMHKISSMRLMGQLLRRRAENAKADDAKTTPALEVNTVGEFDNQIMAEPVNVEGAKHVVLKEHRLDMEASPTHEPKGGLAGQSTDALIRTLYRQAVTSDFARFGNPEVVFELCKEPVNLQEVKRRVLEHPEAILLANASGNTSLHYVVQVLKSKWSQSEIMLTFLGKGACLYAPNRKRETPFTLITSPERKADMTFSTVSESIRAYQAQSEGKVPFYKEHQCALEELGFHAFSQVFTGSDGCTPLVYSGSQEGLKIFDVSGPHAKLLQHYPGLPLHNFRTAVERGGSRDADHEVLVEGSGGIFRFRHVETIKKHEEHAGRNAYVSPLRGDAAEDGVIGSILPRGVQLERNQTDQGERSSLPPVKESRWKQPSVGGDTPAAVPSLVSHDSPPILPRFDEESRHDSAAFPFECSVSIPNHGSPSPGNSPPPMMTLFGEHAVSLSPVASTTGGLERRRRSFQVTGVATERSVTDSPVGSLPPTGEAMGVKAARRIREGAVVDLGVLDNEGAPLLEIIVPQNTPFLKSCEPLSSTEACCDVYLSHTGPSAGHLVAEEGKEGRFDFRVMTIGGHDKGKSASFYSSGHMLGDPAWVYQNCHVGKKTISGRAVALKQVGNGDYVCLSDTTGADRVVVFSPLLGNTYYTINLESPTARPLSIASKLAKDIVISDREMPCVAIVTDTSVEVHQLSLTKAEVPDMLPNGQLGRGGWTTKLCFNIMNDTLGGRYSCAFSSDPADKKLLILRGGVSWYDVCICDTLANRCYYICKIDRMQEKREKSVANVSAFLSKDGRYLLRRNPDCGLSTVLQWQDIEDLYKREREPINMTFSPISLIPVKLEVFSVAPPQGMLNLVFTDVQSSTSLWEREPEAMQQALDLHNKLLRRAMMRFCGYEVKTEGDAFMVAFHHTIDAVNWCLVSQLLLLMAPWPEEILKIFPAVDNDYYEAPEAGGEYEQQQEVEDQDVRNTVQGIGGDPIQLTENVEQRRLLWRGLRVRMGIHRCKPLCKIDPSSKRMDYFGPPVNLSARISGHGKGGQVILTEQVAEVLEADARQSVVEVWVRALGDVQLKGIREKHSLYELLPMSIAGRSDDFGNPRSAQSPKGFAGSMEDAIYDSPESPESVYSKETASPHRGPHPKPRKAPKYPGVASCSACAAPFFDAAQKFCGECGKRRVLDVAAL
eukprot:TRINITY_DN13273_c0_g1_i1.p1 TRINITY_DN13273_c0_g1~~TRINITY_DN13273_c0_g1_i1.p1  ORF type:complete len:1391 (+),score=436.06 TRINITY_DN13273_c0_g1_i1:77-4174(+)